PVLAAAAVGWGGGVGAGRPATASAAEAAKPAASAKSAEPTVVRLWPGKAPGETADLGPEKPEVKGDVVTRLTNVSDPTITVYPAPRATATGVALLIAPGGGYTHLAWDHEGVQIAAWANSVGVTAAVLKYRVPRRPDTAKDKPPLGALQDAQRAMGLLRSRASDWGADPAKVGMLGFSAGGHLTAWASTTFDKRAYPAVDDADKASSRPDFAVLIYPGGAVEKGTTDLKPELIVTKETPPSFLAMATDDPVNPDNCIGLYQALRKAGVPAEMHLYAKGGHGFGTRPTAGPAATWPARCEEWMRTINVLPKPAAAAAVK
ncbi:MAG: Acetyl esterase/lipase, partial [Phycisphaerales bacterium]|nr:Acetyl esterase/lipase [Phycisphaerales bacterium]